MADASVIINTIAQVVKAAVDLTPSIIKTYEDAKPFAQAIYDTLINDKEITEEDLEALEEKLTELSNELQRPLPPDDPLDED